MLRFRIFLLSLLFMLAFGDVYAQQPQEEIAGAVQADSVQVTRSDKRKERRDAQIRKKSRMLTRDLLEQGRLQFEPEWGFYHGNQININAGHYTKTFANSINSLGYVDGWQEDQSGGKYSGRPVLQILNRRLYCNLEPIITTSRNEIIGIRARDKASYGLSGQSSAIEFESSKEELKNWRAFDTEYYSIENIKEKGDYLISFDIMVDQFNIVANSAYNRFKLECVINIHDGRMAMRIVACPNRPLASYFGYMNILRGNSF